MTLNELRDWATEQFGPHSHKEGQVFAALQGLEEWLGHLARHGVALELQPVGLGASAAAKTPEALEAPAEPPPTVTTELPTSDLDPDTFVHDDP